MKSNRTFLPPGLSCQKGACGFVLTLIIASAVATALLAGCSHEAKEEPKDAKPDKAEESPIKHGANGETVVTLKAHTQRVMGLQTAALAPARLNPEVKGYGRVVDISGLATLVSELTTAKAAGSASEAELKRLKTLVAQSNASERALQTAEAAAVRDRAQAESTQLRLLANWGKEMAARQDLPAFVQSLASLSNALIELDVPVGEALKAQPTGARIVTLTEQPKPIAAQFLGSAPMVIPQMQGRGFLFLVSPNSTGLAPGAAVTGFINLPGKAEPGVVLPREAIVRFEGATWVYRQAGDDSFERTQVNLDRPFENGWFISDGLKAEDKVVVTGAQQLLSEELKGKGGEE